MPLPSFVKLLATSALASGAIFSALTMPLVIFGSEPIVIQAKGESIFEGNLQDIATPYIGLASFLSLTAGVASIGVAGWRQAAQRNEEVEQQLSTLQQCLTQKETQLQSLLLSEKHLESAGLSFFLEDEVTAQHPYPGQSGAALPQPAVVPPEVAMAKSPAYAAPVVAPQRAAVPPQVTVQSAVSPLHAAQAFLSFTRPNPTDDNGDSTLPQPVGPSDHLASEQIHNLQAQLQQMMAQIESLQNNLAVEVPVPVSKAVSSYVTTTLPHLNQRVQALESQWVMRRAVS
jgi:hypothetical protein